MTNRNILALASMAGLVAAAPASAVVTGGALTGGSSFTAGGTFQIIDPVPLGYTVGNNDFNDNNVRAFSEQQNFTLLSALTTDSNGMIAAGTLISSHNVVYDPLNLETVVGTVSFSTPILGLIFTTANLSASDYLGLSQVSYLNPFEAGLEAGSDVVSFIGNTVTFSLRARSPGDTFRVITEGVPPAVVPEPESWALLIAGFGLVGATMRRRRRSASVVA